MKKTPLKRGTSQLKKSALKKGGIKSNEKQAEKSLQKIQDNEFYLKIWEERKHISDLTGKIIPGECSPAYMHHLLPKHKYKNLRYEPDNILLCEIEYHSQIEINETLLPDQIFVKFYEKLQFARNKFGK